MARMLGNNWLMAAFAIVLMLLGIFLSFKNQNFQWLSRFGALVICVGVIVLARPAMVGKDIKRHVIKEETGLSHLDPNHYKAIGEPIPQWVKDDNSSRTAVGWLGPLLCFFGTLTNGFADLLNSLFFR